MRKALINKRKIKPKTKITVYRKIYPPILLRIMNRGDQRKQDEELNSETENDGTEM